MKARNTIFNTIAAAILATSLLVPASAENNVEVTFSNGEAYLVETETTQTETVKPDTPENVRVTFANGNVYLVEDEARATQTEDVVTGAELTDALAEEVLRLTNKERAEHGLAPLARHQALEQAAVDHSQEMRELNYFSHTSPTAGKSTTRQRVNQYGVNPKLVAENIFECSGYDVEVTAKFAVEAFMQSPGHRHNLLNPTATHIGVGFVQNHGTVSVTQVFAAGI